MKLILKERILTIFDSFNIYDEAGNIRFKVHGKLAWGHKLVICDAAGREVGTVRERIIDLMPHFDLYKDGSKVGTVSKKITLFRPKFKVDFRNWEAAGDILQWNYVIKNEHGGEAARIYKKLIRLTDTYVIDVASDDDALDVLMTVLAIEAEKCTAEKKEEKREAKLAEAKADASQMK